MIQKVKDNILTVGSEGSSNVTIILLQHGSIIVDTSLFPEKAVKIRQFVEHTVRKPILYVVNTHYHPDHCFGNVAFEDVQILSSVQTANNIAIMDEKYMENLPKVERLVAPSLTYVDEWFDDNIQIKVLGGHTPDSSIVYVPNEKVLIAGDLIFNDFHPEIVSDSNLMQWIEALEFLLKLKIQYVIPGHGPTGVVECVESMLKYLSKILRLIDGRITYSELLSDENFTQRKFPQLFSWGIENLLQQRGK